MIPKKTYLLSALLLMAASASAQFITDERIISFEDNCSINGVSAYNGNVSLSESHFKDGTSSMKWDFSGKGDYISLKKDLKFEYKDPTGKDLYLSTFVCWVYNETPMPDEIKFEFLKDGKYCCSFPMKINFKGWRAAWVCYERDMQGEPQEGMNEIRIIAPEKAGSLYFDHIMTASKTDHRHQTADIQLPFVNKGNENHWLVVYKHSLIKPDMPLAPVTQREIAEIREIENRFKSIIYTPSKLTDKQFSNLKDKYNYYGIKYDIAGNVTGLPVFFGRAAEAYERIIPEWSKGMMTTLGIEIREFFDLMKNIAYAYHNAEDADHKAELEKMFISMYDHAYDQGISDGSCLRNCTPYGYSFTGSSLAYFMMKDKSEAHGKLD